MGGLEEEPVRKEGKTCVDPTLKIIDFSNKILLMKYKILHKLYHSSHKSSIMPKIDFVEKAINVLLLFLVTSTSIWGRGLSEQQTKEEHRICLACPVKPN